MTSDEWLAHYGKKPWQPEEDSYFWYWSTDMGYNGKPAELSQEDYEFVLPWELFNHLEFKTTYPMCKMYESEEQALADFRVGYNKAVAAGWNPTQEWT